MDTSKQDDNPLGVLLSLLEKEKLEITNFSLASVADNYLKFLSNYRDQDNILENISEFLWVASRLALLKSKMLVSTFDFEEEIDAEEEGDLRDRLVEYKKFKEITKKIDEKFSDSRELVSGSSRVNFGGDLLVNFSTEDLRKIFNQVVTNFKLENENIYQKKEIKETIKIDERIDQIRKVLNKTKRFKFSRIIFKKASRTEVVVSFLSVLELMKQGVVKIDQKENFQDMNITRK